MKQRKKHKDIEISKKESIEVLEEEVNKAFLDGNRDAIAKAVAKLSWEYHNDLRVIDFLVDKIFQQITTHSEEVRREINKDLIYDLWIFGWRVGDHDSKKAVVKALKKIAVEHPDFAICEVAMCEYNNGLHRFALDALDKKDEKLFSTIILALRDAFEHHDPKIRAMALRGIASNLYWKRAMERKENFKLNWPTEEIHKIAEKGLFDSDANVRKNALKILYENFEEELINMVRGYFSSSK